MSNYESGFPLSIANVLSSEEKTRDVIIGMIERAEELKKENADVVDYIPPIVYSVFGKSYNFEYNFLVHGIGWAVNDDAIESDFRMSETAGREVFKYGEFLVAGLLENYYDLVRVNQRSIDIGRYKSAKRIDLPLRFFNVLCIKNGERLARFNAVPFNGMKLTKLIGEEMIARLNAITEDGNFEQVAFGEGQFQEYKRVNKISFIDYVF